MPVLAAGLAAALLLAPGVTSAQSKANRQPPVQPVPPPRVTPPVVFAPATRALPPAAQQDSAFEPQEITKIPSEKQKYCRQQNGCKMTGPCKPCDGI